MLRLALLATTTALFVFPSTTHAQQQACADRAAITKRLGTKYFERPVATGVANNGGLLEVLSAKDGSTWSIIVTAPDGKACMFAVGEHWEMLPEERREKPAT